MSVDINWETLTGGPDGQDLAEVIRELVHERFQQIEFPKLIRSVKVHAFDFGSTPPEIIIKDVCDPLPDFYETEEDDVDDAVPAAELEHPATKQVKTKADERRLPELDLLDRSSSPTLTRGAILGGASGYFHFPGLPGTQTPLAAVAGAHYHNGNSHIPLSQHHARESFGSISPSSTATPPSRPISRDQSYFDSQRASAVLDGSIDQAHPAELERNPEDLQVVFHVTYAGDVRLSMTAEVVLDYPMPSFVGIPLKLNITGLTFNGVGILAYIKKRAHLCFLSPEDAEALVGSESAAMPGSPDSPGGGSTEHPREAGRLGKVGGLLEEIKIESEMGESDQGKQVLKNVGKIEKFILEQVQRIFEEEFVYPSFWTFLV